ncbi:hypothetical protein B6A09_1255 [Saccharomyces cerevisiae synthetic construct]|uniref:Putative uncharacterized protein YBR126W-B n=2 Tax=Saccharomyces cerevisiae TaxID=4932 RepID=YB26B_YEAST|nr:RecName: Full=Putative uncharacterized protein YBR126W-B [Saccharomyces cerevisiae S288C]pir/S78708/ protein YBR126w-a - yeast (Saccharomyces cerevisiae) [Saccharomyces cerevisiae]ARB01926.1 hypothetical protein B6A09_1255 [Saccharomyces cerevisiae synthetic construct]EWG87702.1 hypothetical protein R008_B11701 [Saccharomyces cerevisiae R008]EWG92477.1 hypothetical protein P301_B11691 [Saccharomyces cerevisiae P301]EWG97330.1 hypothetical protein R103_B50061 [Saccharomyces cerevisiae R103]
MQVYCNVLCRCGRGADVLRDRVGPRTKRANQASPPVGRHSSRLMCPG